MSEPKINWIENDPKKYNCFQTGSRFLVAIEVTNHKKNKTTWEFDVIQINCDGDWLCLEYGSGETYDSWEWKDFQYFHLLEGEIPTYDVQYDPHVNQNTTENAES